MACGEWLEDSKMVRIVHEAGDFWQYMGAEADIGKCLYPEEAIYLIETGELEVMYGNMPLSIQQAQATMLQDSHQMDNYLVYAHLTRSGCKVVRHQPHLWFTRYEKTIRLDQHQATKRILKLQLKDNMDISSTEKDTQKGHSNAEKVDDALAEFYASLDTVTDNFTSDSNTTDSNKEELTDKTSSHIDNNQTRKKRGRTSSSDLNEYEIRRIEYLALFPSVHGKSLMNIRVESSELLPPNSVPTKDFYEITQEGLNYYSKYEENPHQTNVNQYHQRGMWGHNKRGNNKWNTGRNTSLQRENWPSQQRNTNEHYSDYRDRHAHWKGDMYMQNYSGSNSRYQQSQACEYRSNYDYSPSEDDDMSRKPPWNSGSNSRYQQSQACEYRSNYDYSPSEDNDMSHNPPWNSGSNSRYQQGQAGGYRSNYDHYPSEDKDMSIKPPWKTKRRKKVKQQREYYPSSLMKLNVKVNSWQEYKNILNEKSSQQILLHGPGRTLWRGSTPPLIKPGLALSTRSVLAACNIGFETNDVKSREWKLEPELQLPFHYDVYLPNVSYRKSQPTQPSKRITVMREGEDPTPGQILDITTRFNDDVPVACALVVCGEIRFYTLTPISIPQPSLSV